MNEENKASLIGRALDLNALVEYQNDSIVSKTIIDKKAGTVTLFAFDQGQGLSEHTSPFDALVQVIDGAAEVTIEGNPLKVRAGELIIMPAGKPHSLKAIEKFKMILLMIRSQN